MYEKEQQNLLQYRNEGKEEHLQLTYEGRAVAPAPQKFGRLKPWCNDQEFLY
jgi:hypothetical protein